MTLILLDGCEDFSAFSTASVTVVPGRYVNGFRLTSSAGQFVYRPYVTQEADTVTIGFAFRWVLAGSGTCTLMVLFSDAGTTSHNTLRIEASGALAVTRGSTVLATSASGLVVPGLWNYLEMQIRLHDTLGAFSLLLNGASVLSFGPGDTKNAGTKTVYDTIQWTISTSNTVEYDDVYVCTATTTPDAFLGGLTVETLLPNGNGALNEWVGMDGNSVDNYLHVDDPHPISTSEYVASDTVGDQDLYTLSDLVHTTGTIVGVCHSAHMIRTDSLTPMSVRLVNHGAVDTKSAALDLATSYRTYHYALTVDPETGVPFTIADVNTLQTGVELA